MITYYIRRKIDSKYWSMDGWGRAFWTEKRVGNGFDSRSQALKYADVPESEVEIEEVGSDDRMPVERACDFSNLLKDPPDIP